jgi:hypothetical protein
VSLGRDYRRDCGENDPIAAAFFEQGGSCSTAKAKANAVREPFRKFNKAMSQGVPQNIAMAMLGLHPAGDEESVFSQFTHFIEGAYIALVGTEKFSEALYDGDYTKAKAAIDEVQRKGENAQNRWNAPTQAQVLSAAADYRRAFDAEDYGRAYRILSGDPELVSVQPGGSGNGGVQRAPALDANAKTSAGKKVAIGLGLTLAAAAVGTVVYARVKHRPVKRVLNDAWRGTKSLPRAVAKRISP